MTRPNDTSIGGRDRNFPTTIWADVLAAADPTDPDVRERLGRLLHTYWKPVFVYIRVKWKKSIEDAKDLTQSFLTRILEKDVLARMDPEKGSFRGYMKTSLRNFLINEEETEEVRRGRKPIVRLDASPAEFERLGLASKNDTPERACDREWFRTLFAASLLDVEERLKAEGKEDYFEALRQYCLDPDGDDDLGRTTLLLGAPEEKGPTYEDVAKRMGLSLSDVRNRLHYCRKLLKEIVRDRIRDYVTSDKDVDDELSAAAGS